MSQLVLSVPPLVRADHGTLLGHCSQLSQCDPRPRCGHALTKRRSVDFGRIAASLCRSA